MRSSSARLEINRIWLEARPSDTPESQKKQIDHFLYVFAVFRSPWSEKVVDQVQQVPVASESQLKKKRKPPQNAARAVSRMFRPTFPTSLA